MKRYLLSSFLFATIASFAFSVPYASRIRVSSTAVQPGQGCTITYFINQAGGTATINIIKASDSSVVATFAGTATLGANTVAWNGTADNASGAVIDDGTYRVKVTVAASAASGWVEIASNSSLGNYVPAADATIYQTLFAGFSPNKAFMTQNTDSDAFGYIYAPSCYTPPTIYGCVVLNPDLSTYDGSDGQSTWLNYTGTVPNTTAVWSGCFDPQDPNAVWVCGQATDGSSIYNDVFYNQYNDTTLTDVTSGDATMSNARGIAIDIESSQKFAYVTRGGAISKTEVTTNQVNPATSINNLLNTTDFTGIYARDVIFDKNGNLYFVNRYSDSSTGAGGGVYRWDASTLVGVASGGLSKSNNSWEVLFPTVGSDSSANIMGIGIAGDGSVYAEVLNDDPDNDGSCRGIYLVGNISMATNKRTLAISDRVLPFYLRDSATQNFYSTNGMIGVDIAGNVYYVDRLDEVIRCAGPEGNTSVPIVAPTSQTIEVSTPPAAATAWCLYE